MTIKKVRILDVHPTDPRFDMKESIIGNVYMLDIEDMEYEDGWAAASTVFELADFYSPDNELNYHEFYAFKYEEVT